MSAQALTLLAALFGVVGGTILAVSLNRVLSELNSAIDFLSTSIQSIAGNGDIYVFTGIDKRLKDAARISNSWVRAGIYCLVASAILTGLSLLNT